MTTSTITRRTAFAGAAALSIVPVVAAASTKQTTIGALWHDAEVLGAKLDAYRAEIAASAQNGGIAGWMRLGGEANALGGQRYGKLMAILHAKPETQSDLVVIARVIMDDEIQNSAKGYAADQFAKATIELLDATA